MSWLSDILDWLRHRRPPTPTPTPTPTPGPTPWPPPTRMPDPTPELRAELVAAFNEQRRLNGGLPPLAELDRLDGWAQRWADQQAADLDMRHGEGFTDVVNDFPGSYVGEIVAKGYTSIPDVVTGWMNSPGHRAEILDPRFTRAGVSWAAGTDGNTYWTGDFAS